MGLHLDADGPVRFATFVLYFLGKLWPWGWPFITRLIILDTPTSKVLHPIKNILRKERLIYSLQSWNTKPLKRTITMRKLLRRMRISTSTGEASAPLLALKREKTEKSVSPFLLITYSNDIQSTLKQSASIINFWYIQHRECVKDKNPSQLSVRHSASF